MAIQLIEREATYASPGDEVFGGVSEAYARFRFLEAEQESWIGAFAWTGLNNNTLARSFGPAGDVFVIAGGQGYVVNVAQRALRHTDIDEYLFDARAVPGRDLVVACSCTYLCAYSSEGEEWVSEDFGHDGIGLGDVTETTVSGWHWQPDGWYGLRVFVDGFRLELASLLSPVHETYADPGLTHPVPVLPQDSILPGTAV